MNRIATLALLPLSLLVQSCAGFKIPPLTLPPMTLEAIDGEIAGTRLLPDVDDPMLSATDEGAPLALYRDPEEEIYVVEAFDDTLGTLWRKELVPVREGKHVPIFVGSRGEKAVVLVARRINFDTVEIDAHVIGAGRTVAEDKRTVLRFGADASKQRSTWRMQASPDGDAVVFFAFTSARDSSIVLHTFAYSTATGDTVSSSYVLAEKGERPHAGDFEVLSTFCDNVGLPFQQFNRFTEPVLPGEPLESALGLRRNLFTPNGVDGEMPGSVGSGGRLYVAGRAADSVLVLFQIDPFSRRRLQRTILLGAPPSVFRKLTESEWVFIPIGRDSLGVAALLRDGRESPFGFAHHLQSFADEEPVRSIPVRRLDGPHWDNYRLKGVIYPQSYAPMIMWWYEVYVSYRNPTARIGQGTSFPVLADPSTGVTPIGDDGMPDTIHIPFDRINDGGYSKPIGGPVGPVRTSDPETRLIVEYKGELRLAVVSSGPNGAEERVERSLLKTNLPEASARLLPSRILPLSENEIVVPYDRDDGAFLVRVRF